MRLTMYDYSTASAEIYRKATNNAINLHIYDIDHGSKTF